jgi:hypothetical protein
VISLLNPRRLSAVKRKNTPFFKKAKKVSETHQLLLGIGVATPLSASDKSYLS